jgi:superkiller protein 3
MTRGSGASRLATSLLAFAAVATLGGCAWHTANRKEMAEAHYKQARAFLQEGRGIEDEMNRRRAYQPLREAISRDPDNPDYRVDLGGIYLFDNRFEDAEREFTAALELDPNHVNARYNLGVLYLATKRPEQAIEEFNTVLADYTFQTPWKAHVSRGQAYFALKDFKQAADAFSAAAKVAPNWGAAWQLLGETLEKDNRLPEAERALHRALELQPENVRGRYTLGLVFYRQKRVDEAKVEFRKVIELDRDGEYGRQATRYLSIIK